MRPYKTFQNESSDLFSLLIILIGYVFSCGLGMGIFFLLCPKIWPLPVALQNGLLRHNP
jgi:hypothetical protein